MHTISRKNLTVEEVEEVHKWLKENKINIQKLRRDFSDVMPLAELLKRAYPRIVDLYNYPKKNSVHLKMINWETFNFKVLSKFNLCLSRDFIEMLANGVPGAAEVLMHEIIRLEKRQRLAEQRNATMRREQTWEENDEVKTVVINKQVGDGIVQVPQKMILYSLYEKMARDGQAKDVIIDAYQQRLAHMENIIKLKSERIDELLMQINGKAMDKKPLMASSGTSGTVFLYEATDPSRRRPIPPAPAPSAEQ